MQDNPNRDLFGIAKLLETEIATRAYEDAITEPAKAASAIVTDFLKGVRFFTLPFALMGVWRERLLRDLAWCRDQVPEAQRVESPPEIAGPAIEKLRFLEDDNPLRQMYLRLLATSIDNERQRKAHPRFPITLSQMSRDDAVILRAIVATPQPEMVVRERPLTRPYKPNYFRHQSDDLLLSHNLPISKSDLAFPDQFFASLQRMGPLGLNLIVTEKDPSPRPDGSTRIPIYISPYAQEFVETCIDVG